MQFFVAKPLLGVWGVFWLTDVLDASRNTVPDLPTGGRVVKLDRWAARSAIPRVAAGRAKLDSSSKNCHRCPRQSSSLDDVPAPQRE
jgi:hypothetical protein